MVQAKYEKRISSVFTKLLLSYLCAGSMWIIVTEYDLAMRFSFPPGGLQAEILKGLVFVGMTAVVLSLILLRFKRTLVQMHNEKEDLLQHLEATVRDRTRHLELANRDLESFAYSVSHDLRSPLRTIDAMTAELDAEIRPGTETTRHAIQRLRANVEKMTLLIESLMRLAQATTHDLQLAEVDLSTKAQAIADELRQQAPEREVEFAIQPGLTIVGDAPLVRVLLRNLFENAWKFSGSVSIARIEVSGDANHFVVRDNGIGFPQSQAEEVFRPFRRLYSGIDVAGNGIGLAIVERIVRGHGWSIEATSEPEVGTEFRVNLFPTDAATGTEDYPEPV